MSQEDSVSGDQENSAQKWTLTKTYSETILNYFWNCILLILSFIAFKLRLFWTQTRVKYKLRHFFYSNNERLCYIFRVSNKHDSRSHDTHTVNPSRLSGEGVGGGRGIPQNTWTRTSCTWVWQSMFLRVPRWLSLRHLNDTLFLDLLFASGWHAHTDTPKHTNQTLNKWWTWGLTYQLLFPTVAPWTPNKAQYFTRVSSILLDFACPICRPAAHRRILTRHILHPKFPLIENLQYF
jgi:hypothetical protein